MGKKKVMLTPQEFAEQVGRPYKTALAWIRKGQVPGVETIQESRGPVYRVPLSAVEKFKDGPKRGRPQKPLSELKGKPRRKVDNQ